MIADVASRWTVPQVVDALTALRRDVTTGGFDSSSRVVPAGVVVAAPPVPPPASSSAGSGATYDVLALLDGLTSVGVDEALVAAVADAVGHLAVSALGVLVTCGVPATKGMAVRRLLTSCNDCAMVRSGCWLAFRVSRCVQLSEAV